MKQRFYLYRRRGTYYLQDSRTGKQQSLETKDKQEALRLLEIKRQTTENAGFNQVILKSRKTLLGCYRCHHSQESFFAKSLADNAKASMF